MSRIAGLGSYQSSAVTYFTTEFALTDKRIIRPRSVEVILTQLESIGVNQPVMERIFDYGTITVGGTGGIGEPFKVIENPMEFRKRVHIQLQQSS